MALNLNTGSIQYPNIGQSKSLPNVGGTLIQYDDTTPAEPVIYPSEIRRLVLVEPNTMVVITGYNLPADTKVAFNKILRSNGIPAQGTTPCCPTITVANSIKLHSVSLPCWVLDRCNPVFIIKTPGTYEVEIIGDYIDVVVTAQSFTLQEVNSFGDCRCEDKLMTVPVAPLPPNPPHVSEAELDYPSYEGVDYDEHQPPIRA